MDKESIEKKAKQMLDKFAKALEKVDNKKDLDSYVDRDEFEREEKKGGEKDKNKKIDNVGLDSEFKERILDNAPEKDHNFILAEKGSWKK